ncbi:MAG TPA: aminoacyl-tRNA hydrolase [Verrucomicrobiae bacterium]|nr:aminoacyl-tRNA hydrolase [Verrucomicrobiae bacterium]
MRWRRRVPVPAAEDRETLLVIGLGNPGPDYAHTRHNAGYDAVDALAGRLGTRVDRREGAARVGRADRDGRRWLLAKPLTFMNESGRAGVQLTTAERVPPTAAIVIHDDLDLPFGRLRVRRGGGAGGHNGIRSLQAAWRTPEFLRVRIGIGRPPPDQDAIDHVLSRPQGVQRQAWPELMARAAAAALAIVEVGLPAAMDQFNQRSGTDRGEDRPL